MNIRTAVFFGAGASKAFGYPLTAEILPRIRHAVEQDKLFGTGAANSELHKALRSGMEYLLPGWAKAGHTAISVTDVLSLIDYSLLTNTTPMVSEPAGKLAELRRLLERAIARVIGEEFYKGEPTATCEAFIKWMTDDPDKVGAITTNYDIEIDHGLFQKFALDKIRSGFDFGFAWRNTDTDTEVFYPRPAEPIFRLYKLHGSLNWLRCDACEHTYINTSGAIDELAFAKTKQAYNTCHCGHWPLSAVLTAPSLVRDVRNPDLLSSFKAATEWLRRASQWVLIGYSLPMEDLAVRSMLIRAYHARGDRSKPRVTVVQRGRDPDTCARYMALFPDCDWIDGGLEAFLGVA